MRKPIAGTKVRYANGEIVTVLSNGRDSAGIYTKVRFDDGSTLDVHRSTLKVIPTNVAPVNATQHTETLPKNRPRDGIRP